MLVSLVETLENEWYADNYVQGYDNTCSVNFTSFLPIQSNRNYIAWKSDSHSDIMVSAQSIFQTSFSGSVPRFREISLDLGDLMVI